ncbi:MAG: acyltransferase [Opitutae bacterium]|nr:acyltransferase [Opitutae bacterium]
MFIKRIAFYLFHPITSARRIGAKFKNFYYLRFRAVLSPEVDLKITPRVTVLQPTYFAGRGVVRIEQGVIFGVPLGGYYRKHVTELLVRNGGEISIGARTHFNNNLLISSWKSITIGDDCLIGHNCEFSDADGHEIDPLERRKYPGQVGEVVLGNNVWLGNNCKILKGTKIGDNSIVAAGAVVKGAFEANVIIGGVPAKVIKRI